MLIFNMDETAETNGAREAMFTSIESVANVTIIACYSASSLSSLP